MLSSLVRRVRREGGSENARIRVLLIDLYIHIDNLELRMQHTRNIKMAGCEVSSSPS